MDDNRRETSDYEPNFVLRDEPGTDAGENNAKPYDETQRGDSGSQTDTTSEPGAFRDPRENFRKPASDTADYSYNGSYGTYRTFEQNKTHETGYRQNTEAYTAGDQQNTGAYTAGEQESSGAYEYSDRQYSGAYDSSAQQSSGAYATADQQSSGAYDNSASSNESPYGATWNSEDNTVKKRKRRNRPHR